MKSLLIPVEVIAHFDTNGKITPYRLRYEKDGIKIMYISKLMKRDVNTFAGNVVEVYECATKKENQEIILVLKYDKEINKWFLTKL